jgi:superfamily II DNA or RNA helicase
VTPVGIGKSVSPIPIPKQIAATSLDIDRPENYPIELLSRAYLTKIDKFQIKPLKLFSFYSQLVGSFAPQEFFNSLPAVEVLENQFDVIVADDLQGVHYSPEGTDKGAGIRPDAPGFFDLIFQLLQPPLRIGATKSIPLPSPLREYQWVGVLKLITNPSFLIADESGLGKTVMVCVALRMLFRQAQLKRALLVCLESAIGVWIDHLQRWSPDLYTTVIRGTQEERQAAWSSNNHVYIVSYDTLQRDVLSEHNLSKVIPRFDLVVADEAQELKNEKHGHNRAVRKVASRYRWALTGVSIKNWDERVVTILNFIIPHFPIRYSSMGNPGRLTRPNIAPYVLRRLRKDVAKELPLRSRQIIWLDLDEAQKTAYQVAYTLQRERLEGYGPSVSRMEIVAAIQALKQICNFAPGAAESPKTTAIRDLLDGLGASDPRVIIFSQYEEDGILKIRKALSRRGDVSVLPGELSGAEYEKAIVKYMNDPKKKVLIASLITNGEGLPLSSASYLIHFDQWWNPVITRRAEARLHPTEQGDSIVHIYELWMAGTIEERLYHLLKGKGFLEDVFLDAFTDPEDLENTLSLADLLGLFDLSIKEAIPPDDKSPEQAPADTDKRPTELDWEIEDIKKRVMLLSSGEFEQLVKIVVQKIGYPNVEKTSSTLVDSVDIEAWGETGGVVEKVHVHCKRISTNVGIKDVRDLYETVKSLGEDETGILMTLSDFTDQCKPFAILTGGKIRLVGGQEFTRLIQQHVLGR